MARGTLTPVQATRAGVAVTAATTGDSVNGHQVANDGRIVLCATNTNGSSTSHTITVLIPGAVDGIANSPKVVTLAAGATRFLGPYPTSIYGSPLLINVADNEVHLSAFHVS